MLLLAWVYWAPVSGGFVCEPCRGPSLIVLSKVSLPVAEQAEARTKGQAVDYCALRAISGEIVHAPSRRGLRMRGSAIHC